MSKSIEQAKVFVERCKAEGFQWECTETVVRVIKTFSPGDADAFAACDMMAPGLLALVPLKGGSIWGTDGGSVGGFVGLKSGEFKMNKSGTGARFIAALKKLKGI